MIFGNAKDFHIFQQERLQDTQLLLRQPIVLRCLE